MRRLAFLTLLLVIMVNFQSVAADDLLSGELIFTGEFADTINQPEVKTRLNLILEDMGWTNGFHIDFDLENNLQELDRTEITLNEAYYDYYGDNYDLRLGKQLLPWGTALKINPTDNLNPPLPGTPFAEKKPILMVKGNYYFPGNYRLTGVIIPYHRPVSEKVTLPGGQELTARQVAEDLANSEMAVKFSGRGVAGYDFSISLFKGYEDLPWLNIKQTPAGPRPEAFFRDYLVLGLDMATSIKGIGFWGEGAYRFLSEGDDYYSLVVGADYKFPDNLYLEGQLIYLQDQWGSEDTLIQGAVEKPFAGIHNLRLGMIINPEQEGYLLQPEVEFSLAEATTLNLKYQYLNGQLFGNTRKNSQLGDNKAIFSLNYSF